MLHFPNINPVALSLGPVQIHWYGLMYLFGIGISWWLLAKFRLTRLGENFTKDNLSDLIFWAAVGIIAGGRLGYVLFYNFNEFIQAPWLIVQVWRGGMSFHGGLIGVIVCLWIFARKHNLGFFAVIDFIAPVVPIGLGLGRIGNFINAELWGKPTSASWGMIFPYYSDPLQLPRHPSQLYQFLLEGVILFTVLWIFSQKKRPTMAAAGLFSLLYGIFRFAVEFVRMPDAQLGYLAFGWLTMGQILCIPMIIAGIYVLYLAYRPSFKF